MKEKDVPLLFSELFAKIEDNLRTMSEELSCAGEGGRCDECERLLGLLSQAGSLMTHSLLKFSSHLREGKEGTLN
tara:strand:+ start:5136 stop:5360 length:225 start_codon:yes stop_codon:yes gene_type:complete